MQNSFNLNNNNNYVEKIFLSMKEKDIDSTILLMKKFLLISSINATAFAEKNMYESFSHQSVKAFNRSAKITLELSREVQMIEREKHLVPRLIEDYIEIVKNSLEKMERVYQSLSDDLNEQIDSKYHDAIQVALNRSFRDSVSSFKQEVKNHVKYIKEMKPQLLNPKRSKNNASTKNKSKKAKG